MSHPSLSLSQLQDAVRDAVAIRAINALQPAAGKGAKVFPPTYAASEDGKDKTNFGFTKYCTEQRKIDGVDVPCVLLDSVASQANRMELALLDGWESEELSFPVVRVDFSGAELLDRIDTVTSLDAPHRIYDAILRDSVDADGMLFRKTTAGEAITEASPRNATSLYTLCPTALVFGAWDSTGPKGRLSSKFQRLIASEIVAINATSGARVGGRMDPLGIEKVMDVAYELEGVEQWGVEAPDKKAKSVRPSQINHGNIAPTRSLENGGVTFDHARQTTVLSLPALRRLKFPVNAAGVPHVHRPQAELAARTALAALALAGICRAHALGHDLRSGTLLVGDGPLALELVQADGSTSAFQLTAAQAGELLEQAGHAAAQVGMAWQREPIPALRPAPKLITLLQASQTKAQMTPADAQEK